MTPYLTIASHITDGSNTFNRICLLIFTSILLAACETPPVKEVETKKTIEVAVGEKPKPILFKGIVVRLDRGHVLGQVSGGMLCAKMSDLSWRGGRTTWSTAGLDEVFKNEFEKNNYEIVGDPDALFEDPSSWKAEFLVAGLMTDLQANLCYPNAGFGNYRDAKGNAYIKVEWQIYSRLDRQVVYKKTTEGNAEIVSPTSTAEDDVFLDAFSEATNNLMADKEFHDLVTSMYQTTLAPALEFDPISLAVARRTGGDISKRMSDVRSAVVTVYAGDSHGSGFIIDPSGYVLTNAHVVGGATFVKVKLATGREILGEVLRHQKRRDVALVKVEETRLPSLSVRPTELGIGAEVYAVGSPLDDALSTTVSRGIVSGYRVIEGLKFIQSDVNVQPGSSGGPLLDGGGNVIGVTSGGRIGMGGAAAGLNFFVPIDDAFDWLFIAIPGRSPAPVLVAGTPIERTSPQKPKKTEVAAAGISASEPTESEIASTSLESAVKIALLPPKSLHPSSPLSGDTEVHINDKIKSFIESNDEFELVYAYDADSSAERAVGSEQVWPRGAASREPSVAKIQKISKKLGADGAITAWFRPGHSHLGVDRGEVEIHLVDVTQREVYNQNGPVGRISSMLKKLFSEFEAERKL